jgi:hypothetical protein
MKTSLSQKIFLSGIAITGAYLLFPIGKKNEQSTDPNAEPVLTTQTVNDSLQTEIKTGDYVYALHDGIYISAPELKDNYWYVVNPEKVVKRVNRGVLVGKVLGKQGTHPSQILKVEFTQDGKKVYGFTHRMFVFTPVK